MPRRARRSADSAKTAAAAERRRGRSRSAGAAARPDAYEVGLHQGCVTAASAPPAAGVDPAARCDGAAAPRRQPPLSRRRCAGPDFGGRAGGTGIAAVPRWRMGAASPWPCRRPAACRWTHAPLRRRARLVRLSEAGVAAAVQSPHSVQVRTLADDGACGSGRRAPHHPLAAARAAAGATPAPATLAQTARVAALLVDVPAARGALGVGRRRVPAARGGRGGERVRRDGRRGSGSEPSSAAGVARARLRASSFDGGAGAGFFARGDFSSRGGVHLVKPLALCV